MGYQGVFKTHVFFDSIFLYFWTPRGLQVGGQETRKTKKYLICSFPNREVRVEYEMNFVSNKPPERAEVEAYLDAAAAHKKLKITMNDIDGLRRQLKQSQQAKEH